MATDPRPLCPETPHKPREQKPHRERPSRPPSIAKPFIGRQPWEKPPGPKWAPGEYDALKSIIDEHRKKRREAIDTIRRFRSQSPAYDVKEVAAARDYLEHWRENLRDDIVKALPDIDPKYHELTPKPANPDAFRNRPSPRTFDEAVSTFRTANAARLKAMPTAQLRLQYNASRVVRHTPDILAVMPLLDNDDAARAMIALRASYDMLKDDLAAQATDDLIEGLMDHPRLPDPVFSPAVMAEMDILHEQDPPGTPHPALAPDLITTNRDWMERTATRINTHISDFLENNRWNILGSFMGMLVTSLDDAIFPTLLADANAITETLSAQTAVMISLLKTGLTPDHTDDEEGVKLFWEILELYAEEHEIGEIPPSIIIATAEALRIPLLLHAPQPTG